MSREPVEIVDVGPRDGLQNEAAHFDTEAVAALIETARRLEERLEHPVPGLVTRAGKFPQSAQRRQ